MTTYSRSLPLALLCSALFLHGCSSVKKTLGIEKDAPDEFAVMPSTQSLEMPPDFYVLPTPQPGVPRPQEVKAKEKTKAHLLGTRPTPAPSKTTPGQEAIRKLAKVEEGEPDIRAEIDKDSHIETDKNILHKLGIKKEEQKGEPLNPHEEARALEVKGIPRSPTVTQK